MRTVKKVWDAIFDFFCGDYRVLAGVAVTLALVLCLERVTALAFLRPASGVVLVVGVVVSFGWSVLRSIHNA